MCYKKGHSNSANKQFLLSVVLSVCPPLINSQCLISSLWVWVLQQAQSGIWVELQSTISMLQQAFILINLKDDVAVKNVTVGVRNAKNSDYYFYVWQRDFNS